MKFECDNCEGLTDDIDTVIVLDEEDNVMKPYCRRCWNIMNCYNLNDKGLLQVKNK